MAFIYDYPRPAVTVDCIVLRRETPKVYVLLIQRDNPPFEGAWALPGGFVDENEPLDSAAYRELKEETGIDDITLKQLHTFGDPGRDPRGHTISVVYYGWYQGNLNKVQASDDARDTGWMDINKLKNLAFDHQVIIEFALSLLNTGALRDTNFI